ncbi:extracellular solute-binding protein [Paenibacillus sp. J5C_2022]|uniref:extracellular solute-binding protein n=1 Tax=Paenibacillus sp. J5C2022 TaxID=2977129 RepID=UPI0021CEC2BE|nr:extracellular solute-binding protein [Paenibacillus sp. J5C2022]MCU6708903.1 extracellular solute-binding protein [Paenibacillus sp. J5C2022]
MNRTFRKMGFGLSLLACLSMATAACSNGNGGSAKPDQSPSAAPKAESSGTSTWLSEKPVTFKWFVGERREAPIRDDWQIFQEIFQKTNVKVKFEAVPQEGLQEKRQILIATNSVTDFMPVPHADARLYGQEGVFLDLAPYIEEHAPNMKKLFETYPHVKHVVTGADGGIYSIPIVEGIGFNYTWIARQDLMDKYNLEAPKNPEELYEMLKTLKKEHPDSYPFITPNVSGPIGLYTIMLRMFTGIEGYLQMEPDSGEYQFAGDHPGFKEALQYMNKLYAEELLDKEYAILTGAQWEERMLTGKSFVTYHWKTRNEQLTNRAAEAGMIPGYEVDVIPLPAADGIKPYLFSRELIGQNGLAISAGVKDKVTAVKFLDYLLGEEGSDYLALGIEGKTYDRSEGEPKFLESLGPAPYDQLRGEWGIWYTDVNLDNGKSRLADRLTEKAQRIEEQYMPYVVPAPNLLVLTEEENELRKEKLDNLTVYIEEKMTEFVTGRSPITDENLQDFLEQCKKLGAYELKDIYNAAHKRGSGS